MANEEHLEILRQGVDVWNQWRVKNPGVKPDLADADLQGARLEGINLIQTVLRGTNLTQADLTQAVLSQAVLVGATLYGADLREAQLAGAGLYMADLVRADLRGANLREAVLARAVLVGAALYRADLTQVDFTQADLTQAVLSRAVLTGVNLEGAYVAFTTFGDLDLRSVQGLDRVRHSGPSHISIDTLYRSNGEIPEIFLRGCGVPDSMIEYARSLVTAERPIDYYHSVFISYSSHDAALAERLYADLQAKGVRCWFAPHDLAIGEVITRGIDEAIRISDKLLIILSEASMQSNWVAFEVNQALHRELDQGRTMLFPIRLDDVVLHTPTGWAAQLRTRNIGNFCGWKDHDAYQAAFTRLLQDLKAKQQTRST